jgi:hypothetical protein
MDRLHCVPTSDGVGAIPAEDEHLNPKEDPESLRARIEGWLAKEGYPLEFAVANVFESANFEVLRGLYTPPSPHRPAREVDVVAQSTTRDSSVVRLAFVIECKWSADKPWVFFCHDRGMTTAACATQSISSALGEMLLWKEAGNASIERNGLFSRQRLSAFGGRQAFAKSADVVFDSLRAVAGNAAALASQYDRDVERCVRAAKFPEFAVVMFPVVVVEGRIFQASPRHEGVDLDEVSRTRVHFRGAGRAGRSITTIDVVRADELESFVRERGADVESLSEVLLTALRESNEYLGQGRLHDLPFTQASRGVLGRPPLLQALLQTRQPPGPEGSIGPGDPGAAHP